MVDLRYADSCGHMTAMAAAAAAAGQPQALQQLCEMITFESLSSIDKAICLWSAAAGYAVVDPGYLHRQCEILFSPECDELVQFPTEIEGSAEGQAAVIQCLRNATLRTSSMRIFETASLAEALCRLTAARGSLLLLKTVMMCPTLPGAGLAHLRLKQGIAQAAAKHGQLAILQWMRLDSPRMPFNAATFQLAAMHHSSSMLLWLLQSRPQTFQIIVPDNCPVGRLLCLAHAGWTVPWRQKPALWDMQRKYCAFYGAARWCAKHLNDAASLGSLPDDIVTRIAINAGIHWELKEPL